MGWLSNLFRVFGKDLPSPQDWVKGLSLYAMPLAQDSITIPLKHLVVPLAKSPIVWMPGAISKSLDPVMDVGNDSILIAGADEADHKKLVDFLKVGDIAVYRFPADITQPFRAFIEHRIVAMGVDEEGKYFLFKGDNNRSKDSYIVREENLKWVSIGVIY